MAKGISKQWTPGKELEFEELIKRCRTFAEQHQAMLIRDILKYDARSKEGRRAMAQASLRMAVATDKDLEELAELQVSKEGEKPGEIPGLHRASLSAESLALFKKTRAKIKEKGIKLSEICR